MERKEEYLSVKIDGLLYKLKAEENAWYMRKIAQDAERMLHEIKRTNPRASAQARATLALINTLDQLVKCQNELGAIRRETEAVRNELRALQAALVREREEKLELQESMQHYRSLCARYESKLLIEEREEKKRKSEPTPLERRQLNFEDLT